VQPRQLAACALVLGVLALALRVLWRDAWRRRRFARARARGAEGEVKAAVILQRLGFTILGRQVGGRYGLGVDGEQIEVGLRADYVVEAQGRRFVAEVKTGTFAPRLETAATRRQLLEYRVAFDVDGVLLVDADAGRVRLVEFPLSFGAGRSGQGARAVAWGLAGIVAGALGALAFLERAR